MRIYQITADNQPDKAPHLLGASSFKDALERLEAYPKQSLSAIFGETKNNNWYLTLSHNHSPKKAHLRIDGLGFVECTAY